MLSQARVATTGHVIMRESVRTQNCAVVLSKHFQKVAELILDLFRGLTEPAPRVQRGTRN